MHPVLKEYFGQGRCVEEGCMDMTKRGKLSHKARVLLMELMVFWMCYNVIKMDLLRVPWNSRGKSPNTLQDKVAHDLVLNVTTHRSHRYTVGGWVVVLSFSAGEGDLEPKKHSITKGWGAILCHQGGKFFPLRVSQFNLYLFLPVIARQAAGRRCCSSAP